MSNNKPGEETPKLKASTPFFNSNEHRQTL
jgi:hypothetical protein